ncbi:MAG: glycosyltransferase [Chthoniobacterales bacterium]
MTEPGRLSIAWLQDAPALPFTNADEVEFLKNYHVEYATSPFAADILLSLTSSGLRFKWLRRLLFWKPLLIWTNEPRFDVTFPPNTSTAHQRVMNVYTGDVFWHNLHFLGSYHQNNALDLGVNLKTPPACELDASSLAARKKFCVCIYAWRKPAETGLVSNGLNIDLNERRQTLAIILYRRGLADIVGNGWPNEVSTLEQSGYENGGTTWWNRKLEILRDYRFNVCFENTIWPNYCTEKIWHSIAAGCLPVYWGRGTRIYETFPPNSFVDASEFESDDALISFLEGMTDEEHLARFKLCRQTLLTSCVRRLALPQWNTEIIQKFAHKVLDLAAESLDRQATPITTSPQPVVSTQPLVSVVLLTYNRPHLLRVALESVVSQTYQNLEILVCDNASEQATTDIVRSFTDSRIIHHRHETNIGMTANVQDGFLHSRGKYLTNLHDDDFWAPRFIERMVETLEAHPEAVLAFSDHSIVDGNGVVNESVTRKNSSLYARTRLQEGLYQPFKKMALVDLSVPIAMATVFRKDGVAWNDFADLPSVYDYWLAYLTSRDGAACYYVNEKLTYYRHHGNSESTKERLRVNDAYIAIYKIILDDPRVAELRRYFIPRYADHHRDAAVSLLRSGDRKRARDYLKQGLKIHPSFKMMLTYLGTCFPSILTEHLPKRLRFK